MARLAETLPPGFPVAVPLFTDLTPAPTLRCFGFSATTVADFGTDDFLFAAFVVEAFRSAAFAAALAMPDDFFIVTAGTFSGNAAEAGCFSARRLLTVDSGIVSPPESSSIPKIAPRSCLSRLPPVLASSQSRFPAEIA